MDDLADDMGRLLSEVAPDAYQNLIMFSAEADSCRIGTGSGPKPFSGVTSVLDFCAHAHHDRHNINGGCTMVGSNTCPILIAYGRIDVGICTSVWNFSSFKNVPSVFARSQLNQHKYSLSTSLPKDAFVRKSTCTEGWAYSNMSKVFESFALLSFVATG